VKKVLKSLLILLGAVGGLLFFWLVVLKLASKLMGGHGGPCPSAPSWLVDNPVRRWYTSPVLDRVAIQPGETVLEVGPGNGSYTAGAAQRVGPVGEVVAIDIEPKMIARVRKRIEAEGIKNIETHVADVYDLPFESASFDLIYMIAVINEIPNISRALLEFHRVLKPTGTLVFSEIFTDPDYPLAKSLTLKVQAEGFQLKEKKGCFFYYTLIFTK